MEKVERVLRDSAHTLEGLDASALNFPWVRVETPHSDFLGREVRSDCPKCTTNWLSAPPVTLFFAQVVTLEPPTPHAPPDEQRSCTRDDVWIGQCPDCGTVLWTSR